MDQPDKEKESAAPDPSSFLLPTKEVHSPASAERVNAAALLDQEQHATLVPPAPATPTPPTPPPPPEVVVPALETYQGDIEKLVQQKNVSVVSIAAAEATRRAAADPAAAARTSSSESTKSFVTKAAMIVGGLVLAGAAAGLGIAAYSQFFRTVPAPAELVAPLMRVDGGERVVFSSSRDFTPNGLMTTLNTARERTALSLGLINWLSVTHEAEGETPETPASAQEFLQTLAPETPEGLLRTIEPDYLLGVHVYDGNQALLLLRVDSYERAYAGMLEWEYSMYNDLQPLFMRNPRPRTEDEVGTTTLTTTPQLLRTGFVDQIVENRDARVVLNTVGDILLLWTFLDRNTIAITTNEATLREIISRLTVAPVVPGLGS